MPSRTPRDRARERTLDDITRIGRRQLTEVGAAGLSLRGVARELGVVSSAVYRYVASRDELLTLLVVDAYDELGDEVDAAVVAAGPDPYRRFVALGDAVRAWATREPARYALLYGTPVPGYAAPGERTTTPGTRVVLRIVGIVEDAQRTGRLTADDTPLPPALHDDFARIAAEFGTTMTDGTFARCMLVWSSLFGRIGFEVFGQYGAGTFTANDELFAAHVALLAEQAGLRPPGE
ncbi:TetR/AcrR family transcriptional regulator [Rhodococcus rhodnii]|uniref:TetR/AcrR family transcriptional regulator n=2 Tax=Rhodococcus rhodnii TaxID=38312 RepID=A0A6P2CAA7_9NOCA|nr:TetR/AcrR family transcriptional regulator [Rhodococcus rhodnii]EOM74546.1 putative TetR family transcriptional [Rhodococcus rhodnii LMG 5362]TXG89704.1 TetR/AcrR family transcriptional regulator [Rhodococcus rhodnii]